MAKLRFGQSRFQIPREEVKFIFSETSWGSLTPPEPHVRRVQGFFPGGKLIAGVHVIPTLRISAAIALLPRVPSWRRLRQHYVTLPCSYYRTPALQFRVIGKILPRNWWQEGRIISGTTPVFFWKGGRKKWKPSHNRRPWAEMSKPETQCSPVRTREGSLKIQW
jgi:hypothetical protein